jgi:hypothetical protein
MTIRRFNLFVAACIAPALMYWVLLAFYEPYALHNRVIAGVLTLLFAGNVATSIENNESVSPWQW